MDSLFIKTMKKLQENRRLEKSKTILKEDINDEITDIEDVEGFEHDVITVMDPNLSTEEFIEKQDEVNKLIEETPEGEKVVDTEYVGQKIYTCPLCLTNFYSETEMGEEQKCPVCYETPTEFIYLGTVEQDINGEDEEMLNDAEETFDSTEPAEGEEDIDVDNPFEEGAEGSPEVSEEPIEDEEETLTASKKISTKGKVIKEGFEKVQATLPLNNSLSMGIIVSDDGSSVQYMYSNDEDKVLESEIEYNDEGEPFFKDERGEVWMISDFMRTNYGESMKLPKKKLVKENLQVGGSLYFKVKNNIIATDITNIYVDDFNDKTYVQYTNPEGTRAGTMSAEEILKGLEEGTITSENPVPEEPAAPTLAASEPEMVEEPAFENKRVRAFEFKELSESVKSKLLKEGKTEKELNEFWFARNGIVIANKKNAKIVESKLNEDVNLEQKVPVIQEIMSKYCNDPIVSYDSFGKVIQVNARIKSNSSLSIHGKIGNGKTELLTASGPNILNKEFIDCLQELYSEVGQ